jgi:peptidyl-prolyl cis-trans isomerase B (cyclophilin B)
MCLPPHLSRLQSNRDLSSAAAFRIPHTRPGTVSLSLSENDEAPGMRDRAGYK